MFARSLLPSGFKSILRTPAQNAGSELRLSFEQSMRPLNYPDLRAFMEDFERKQKDRSLHCVSRGTDIGP